MQGSDEDDRVDQFEFMVGSLLMLNKIDRNDVGQIMDKFRELAGDKGFILSQDLAAREEEKYTEETALDSTSVEDEQMQL